jgi:hypothetical protein
LKQSFVPFVSRVAAISLFPFAAALGIDVYVAAERVAPSTLAVIAGATACLLALFFWYAIEALYRAGPGKRSQDSQNVDKEQKERAAMPGKQEDEQKDEGTPVKDKVNDVLTEARIVLPGAQALLGFQLAAVLNDGFEKLPSASKYVHLGSMFAVALATILLMAPAAYHRIAERGEETEHFHQVATRMLISAMAVLALGLSGDFYVVVNKILQSSAAGIVFAVASLMVFYGLWFGYTLMQRQARESATAGTVSLARHEQAE